jgi:diguanylate cyclase (GGDEF)-like protein
LVSTQITAPLGKGPGWLTHAMISPLVAFAGVDVLRNRILAISGAILLLTVLLGSYLSGRSIVSPIKLVTAAMTKVSVGEVEVDLNGQHRRDEIGQMLKAISIFREKLENDNEVIRGSAEALRLQNFRFDAALSNMSQGLSMFDGTGSLIVANRQFAELYALPSSFIGPGTTLQQILEQMVRSASYSEAEAEQYSYDAIENAKTGKPWNQLSELSDGRVLSIAHRPMAEGGWVSTHADITEQRRAEAQIAHMAKHDALTGLPNRVLFRSRIEEALRLVPRDQTVAVLCLDLDRFKNVNDTLGHPIGDALLQEVADRLQGCARQSDTIARLGGDEFAIVQAGCDQPSSATGLAQRIIETLSAPFEIEGHHIVIGASLGIAIAPTDGNGPDQLMKNADLALYRGKADGRGAYRFFEAEMDAKMQTRRALESDLRKALTREEFEVFYQPLVNIKSDEIIGFEALVRWHHPERGLLRPGDFIPVAEESGLIVALGGWVLKRACSDAASWPENIRLSVNVSPVQFLDRNLVEAVFTALAFSHLNPTRLDLEITETVLLRDSQGTLEILHRLGAMGVQISMDDFGTGYSSLSYLQKFPFSKIKIDQSFIQNLSEGDDQSVAIIRAVTGLSRSLGMITTAEGVETVEQVERLRLEGCTEMQGYYVSRPRPLAEATALLTRGTAPISATG